MHVVSWIVSAIAFVVCFIFQVRYFKETARFRELFSGFFDKSEDYGTEEKSTANGETLTQLKPVGKTGSDLNVLIEEINHYVMKTKGTTDFAVIQNKVERKLNMRYDQSVAKLSFPTYIGLMGTFLGVFMGIFMFILGFDTAGGISDTSIKNLLIGVLVSMSTSLVGLFLTTWNNARAGEARKKIEEDKNEFYDFVQTELMPSLDVSLVAAITKLHETVDRFEPAFDRVINRFQTTFDNCTKAFGDSFEDRVLVVANAVDVMGENMDKINENIDLQKKLIDTFKGDELVRGLDRYIEASNNFVSITQSLNKFEEARRMMLAATQESINLQNAYSDSLQIPREVAVRINQILDRIKDFEESINRIGGQLDRREILGNDVVNKLQEQISGISKKGKIADKYLEMADGRLEDLYSQQTKIISEMNRRYKEALEGHMDGFEKMIERQTEELEKRHKEFMEAIEKRLAIEDVRQEFVNLGKLKDIDGKMDAVSKRVPTTDEIQKAVQKAMQDAVQPIQKELDEMKKDFRKQMEESKSGVFGGLFGRR